MRSCPARGLSGLGRPGADDAGMTRYNFDGDAAGNSDSVCNLPRATD